MVARADDDEVGVLAVSVSARAGAAGTEIVRTGTRPSSCARASESKLSVGSCRSATTTNGAVRTGVGR
jgi:hypothetical protein